MFYIIQNSVHYEALVEIVNEALAEACNFTVSDETNPYMFDGEARTFWYCPDTEDYRDSDMMTLGEYHQKYLDLFIADSEEF